ncbi:MAG: TetR/AcrR family transcriptional regulator [Eggerthellaceae bacterium]|nr:TetR/AcrR family transcriptional regulator [Eggerthellaceae bacterium]
MDIRAQRTRDMLVNAFDQLIEKKGMEDISVSELCELSTVRRATFYRHFADMQDFMRFYLATMTERFMQALAADNDLEDLLPYARAMHAHMLQYASEHKGRFRHMMGAAMSADMMDMAIIQVADGIIARIHAAQNKGEITDAVNAEAVGLYYSAGLVHAMRWWLLDEQLASADSLVETGMAQLTGMLGLTAVEG